jgi:hypothetical protein
VVDTGVAGPAAASGYKALYQVNNLAMPAARAVKGAAIDLGALER